jgi:hypothetical protein
MPMRRTGDTDEKGPSPVGFFVERRLEDSSPGRWLSDLLDADLADGAVAGGGELDQLLTCIETDGAIRFYKIARNPRTGGLHSVVLEPLKGANSDPAAAIAVIAPPVEPSREWATVYGELARAHQATVDLRTKLLAALPVLTGAGIGLILANQSATAKGGVGGIEPGALMALAVFGFVVSLGLFLYELRNIRECVMLLERGEALEALAGGPPGQFMGRPGYQGLSQALRSIERPGWRGGGGWISIHRASHLVYGSVLAAWVGLFILGLTELLRA